MKITTLRFSPAAFRELSLANFRELSRDLGSIFLMMVFPFLVMALGLLLTLSGYGNSYRVGVVVPPDAAAQVEAAAGALGKAERMLVTRVSAPDGRSQVEHGELHALLTLPPTFGDDPTVILIGRNSLPAGSRLRQILLTEAGRSYMEHIIITDLQGIPVTEPARGMLPFTLLLCFWFLGFHSIGFYLAQLRQRGTLRLLGLTPLTRFTFLLAQAPSRFALAFVQLLLIAAVSYINGYLVPGRIPGLLVTTLPGIAMIFAFAYLVGGTFKHPEGALIIPMAIMPAVIFLSGFFPLEALPPWVATVSHFVPFTYMADALKHFLLSAPLRYPLWADGLVMVGTTVAIILLTSQVFRWDQGEGR